MKKITLIALSAVMLVVGWGCGEPPPSCFLSCQHLVSYSVVPQGCTSGGTITVCINGTIRIGLDCHGGCNYVLFERINHNLSLTANPSSVYLPSPPGSVTISGQLFNATYGMPMVEYFDNNGYLIGTALASYVSPDGTVISVPTPDLSFVYSGAYVLRVTNKTSSGYYVEVVGTANMTGWGRDRPDSDGDGWYDDQDCHPYDPSRWDCNDPGCGGLLECNAY